MDQGVTTYLLTQGVLGVAVFVLGVVIVFLYKDKQKLQDKYDVLQDARYNESKEDREKIMEPLKEQSKMTEKIYDLLMSQRKGS